MRLYPCFWSTLDFTDFIADINEKNSKVNHIMYFWLVIHKKYRKGKLLFLFTSLGSEIMYVKGQIPVSGLRSLSPFPCT